MLNYSVLLNQKYGIFAAGSTALTLGPELSAGHSFKDGNKKAWAEPLFLSGAD